MKMLKKYFMYLIFYSVGGYIIERIINILFYNVWFDNSFLVGPYQPLYGSGILITIIVYEMYYEKSRMKEFYKDMILIVVAVLSTGMVEFITGEGLYLLTQEIWWDYGEFLPCNYPYVCVYATSLFGVASYLVVRYLHPLIKFHLERVNNILYYVLFGIFLIDIVFTLTNL